MSELIVANTILQQLGGSGRISAMLGTKNFVGDENSLMFDFKMCKKAKKVRITLNSMDTYDIEFYKIRKFEHTVTGDFKGVYCDELKNVFEEFTGLYLSF